MGQETNVRVICVKACGYVLVPATEINLFISPEEPDRNYYTFTCPGPQGGSGCGAVATRPAPDSTVVALLGAGVESHYLAIPSEWREHETGKFSEMPPISEDDLIDFMLGIERYNKTGAWSE